LVSLAEVLGRYSNLGETGAKVRSMRDQVAKDVRDEPWKVPELTGRSRTRWVLSGHESSVRADYEAGMGSVSLSTKYGVPMSTLLDWLRREGIEIRSGGKLSTEACSRSDGFARMVGATSGSLNSSE